MFKNYYLYNKEKIQKTFYVFVENDTIFVHKDKYIVYRGYCIFPSQAGETIQTSDFTIYVKKQNGSILLGVAN